MQHGDIVVQFSLHGEPQKLLTYWRGSLRDILPKSASISILRTRRQHRWWRFDDPNFYLEAMTRTEKKRAELSISDKSLFMTASEIAIARHLTEMTYDWLSGRRNPPSLNQPIPNARLLLNADGGPGLVDVIERFGDPEVISSVTIGAVYTQGEPRHPDVRWLPRMTGVDMSVMLGELKYFEKALAEGQAAELRKLGDRIAGVFRKTLKLRKSKLNKRLTEIFGYGDDCLRIGGRAITDDMIQGYQYEEIMTWLDGEERKTRPNDNIRSWRTG